MYFIERAILGSVWVIWFIAICCIPKQKYRQATFIFFFSQLPSWLFGLIAVEAGFLEYPVRFFNKANATSFTFEYLVLPMLCIFFNLRFPEGESIAKKLGYYLSFLTVFTFLEYLLEKYTLLIKYVHWEWYFTFITMGLFFYLVRVVYKWFFKLD